MKGQAFEKSSSQGVNPCPTDIPCRFCGKTKDKHWFGNWCTREDWVKARRDGKNFFEYEPINREGEK